MYGSYSIILGLATPYVSMEVSATRI
ncbi:hypothetical protein CPAR01_01142 [Colletotrichum paranaense]|uniref:Uncharacterized protein n=2 Tax=Colletotrichum acutatum species complex TaxID=2707335 RepID=A0AAI9XPF4_9PEZI|nr:hypothetical protein CMEL01_04110 [Colletotrichum melonis]KAK1547175.1 hypothetical protein CPAR01_01142 [Colletotrichum paranaense]